MRREGWTAEDIAKVRDTLGRWTSLEPILESLNSRLRKAIESSNLRPIPDPVFGVVMTGQINARTFSVPGSDTPVIAFDSQLFSLLNVFSKAITFAIPLSEDAGPGISFALNREAIRARVAGEAQVLNRFREAIALHTIAGRSLAVPANFLPKAHTYLHALLLDGMELFVLAHEYAHIALGHLKAARPRRSRVGTVEVTELVKSWEHELAADIVGAQLCVGTMRAAGFDPAMSYVGADLYFTIHDVLERAESVFESGKEPGAESIQRYSYAHPPPAVRRLALRQELSRLYGSSAPAMQTLAEFMEFTAEELWDRTRASLAGAHAFRLPTQSIPRPSAAGR
jgi:hypothetical protein